jgi:[ribosomal protein S5]-alanine N-acetyltransferase
LTVLPIKTKRFLLRDFQAEDWTAVHMYAADPDVVQYMDWGPNSEDETKKFIDLAIKSSQFKPRMDFELAIIDSDTNELIGGAGIHIANAQHRAGWMGYCLNKKYWGKGFATEAATALLSFGFTQLGLHRIYAAVFPGNTASANVLKKIGMCHEGRFRDHRFVRGAWRDSDLHAILESDKN